MAYYSLCLEFLDSLSFAHVQICKLLAVVAELWDIMWGRSLGGDSDLHVLA